MNLLAQVDDILVKARGLTREDQEIGICSHSDDVSPGDIFIVDDAGLPYIDDAFLSGAVMVVCRDTAAATELKVTHQSRLIAIDDFQDVVNGLLDRLYGNAIRQVMLIGVTGTNGKSSTAYFSCGLLSHLGVKTGYIGTMGHGVYGESLVKGRNTTPDLVTIKRYIYNLYQQNCKVVVVEVSSHGIALNRISGINFHAGIFTNLSRDHLDFHGSMHTYKSVKQSFFIDNRNRIAIINSDDEVGREIIENLLEMGADNVFSYGMGRNAPLVDKDYRCTGFSNDKDGYLLEIKGENQMVKAELHVYGDYQIENAMAGVALCAALGHPLEGITKAMASLVPVAGRMECIKVNRKPTICIDFAHTPDAIRTVSEPMVKEKIWCVFGAGGDRDRGKRSEMGKVASAYSEHAIVCDDNARSEVPESIVIDILRGIKNKQTVTVCRDRSRAVCYAVGKADPDDVILLLGKGDEDTTDYGQFRLPLKDVDIARKFLELQ